MLSGEVCRLAGTPRRVQLCLAGGGDFAAGRHETHGREYVLRKKILVQQVDRLGQLHAVVRFELPHLVKRERAMVGNHCYYIVVVL